MKVINLQNEDDPLEIEENTNLKERIQRDDKALLNDKDTFNKYFQDNIANSLFLIKHFPHKKLWRAEPYKHSGLVKIADT